MADPRIKQLKIKTGVLKRAVKEWHMYGKELEDEKKRLQQMSLNGLDEYAIRQQGKVIEESAMMIPDSQRRVTEAYSDLKNLIEELEGPFFENEDFKAAVSVLSDVHLDGL